jgi:selT/selW/selH-like putative selenoprotein
MLLLGTATPWHSDSFGTATHRFPLHPLPPKCCRFIALADAIEEAYPNVVVEGNASGPGRPGSFEVTGTNGAVLFSKLSSGGWPQAEVVVDALGAAAACGVPQQ